MPEHKIHRELARMLIGKAHPDVDRFLDCTYPISGAKHRRDWVHSIYGALLYALAKRDPEKFAAGLIHLLADELNPKTLRLVELLLKLW